MAARFILGRAGSGKTHHCIRAVAQALADGPPVGPRRILLVPEQASLQTEKALLAACADHGTHRGEVLSFRFLAYRLLADRPPRADRILSRAGRAMVLQQIAAGLGQSGSLRYFGARRLLPGLYHELGDQIQEFIAAGIAPGALQLNPQIGEGPESLAAKLHDLRLFFEAYTAFLAAGHVDPLLLLDQARRELSRAHWLKDAEIWVDGFASFSMQERMLLAGVARHCANMHISLLLDPAAPGLLDNGKADRFSLFRTTEQTYHRLRDQLAAAGVSLAEPLLMGVRRRHADRGRATAPPGVQLGLFDEPPPAPVLTEAHGTNPRFARAADLAVLEAGLFNDAADPPQTSPQHVTLFAAADPRQELLQVIHEIQRLVARPHQPLRYRDIAIITRSLEHHHHLITTLLDSHRIPYFLDRRRPLREHPLHGLITSLLQLGLQPFGLPAMRRLLKSPFLSRGAIHWDAVENYILEHNIQGSAAWARPWKRLPSAGNRATPAEADPDQHRTLRRLNSRRQELLDWLAEWSEPAEGPRAGREWARRLYDMLRRAKVGQRMARWEANARRIPLGAEPNAGAGSGGGAAGDDAYQRTDAAEHHRDAWNAVMQIFDDFAGALGETAMTLADFTATFQAGLNQLETGMVPPSIDCVLVATIERSRHPDIRAAFVMGFNDGSFPQVRRERKLLNDEDRAVLIEGGLDLEPPARDRLEEERLLAYIALTRAREYLHISYCRSDLDGIALQPSPYLADVQRALGPLPVQSRGSTPADEVSTIWSPAEFAAILAVNAGNPSQARPEERHFWDRLYEAARRRPSCTALLRQALSGMEEPPPARIAAASARAWAGEVLRTSVTALENYAACPFKFFAQHMLGIKRRPLGRMDALKLGGIYHEVLQRFTVGLLAEQLTLADLDDDQIARRLDECLAGGRAEREGSASPAPEQEAAEPFLWDRARSQLLAALLAQQRFQAAGRCRTVASELQFGYEGEGLSAPILITPAGHHVHLRGKIDRVDIAREPGGPAAFVYDYKRSASKMLRAHEVLHGLSLQLLTYLLGLEGRALTETAEAGGAALPVEDAAAAAANAALLAGGAFFLPLVPPFKQVDHPDEHRDLHESFRPRGLFDESQLAALDPALAPGQPSQVVKAKRNQDGGLSATGDAIGSRAFTAVLQHVRQFIAATCDQILDGRVAAAPSRISRKMPCTYCDHRTVCRVEPAEVCRDLPSKGIKWEDLAR